MALTKKLKRKKLTDYRFWRKICTCLRFFQKRSVTNTRNFEVEGRLVVVQKEWPRANSGWKKILIQFRNWMKSTLCSEGFRFLTVYIDVKPLISIRIVTSSHFSEQRTRFILETVRNTNVFEFLEFLSLCILGCYSKKNVF